MEISEREPGPGQAGVNHHWGHKAMPPFAALRAFEAVGRTGGVRRAAQALSLDHAVVSRHLRSLECWTDVKLIDRSSSGSPLTIEGARYFARVSAAFAEINHATAELMHRDEEDTLRIWCAPGFAFRWMMERLGEFRAANPHLDIELHPTEAGPDFSRREADVDIRYNAVYAPFPPPLANLRRIEFASPRVLPVASPEYLAAHPGIASPADLTRHTLLHEENHDNWKSWFAALRVPDEAPISGPRLWHAHLTLEAARRGQGVALGNPFLLGDDLAAGRLIEIGRDNPLFADVVLGAYILTARVDRWSAPALTQFRRWLQKSVAAGMAGR